MVSEFKYALLGLDKDMVIEEARLQTFKGWPFVTGPLNAVNMAKAGFYYTADIKGSDCVRCFCCYKELNNWDDEDDPWKEHLKHQSSCVFAQLQTEEANLSLSQLEGILIHREANRIRKFLSLLMVRKPYMSALEKMG